MIELKSPDVAPYVPSHPRVVAAMLYLPNFGFRDKLCDLGAGRGEIVFPALQTFPGIKGIAIEMSKTRARYIERRAELLGLGRRLEVIQGSFFDYNLSDCDVVTAYLTRRGNEAIKPKLEKELRGSARVVTHDFLFSGWKNSKIIEIIIPDITLPYLPVLHKAILYEMSKIR